MRGPPIAPLSPAEVIGDEAMEDTSDEVSSQVTDRDLLCDLESLRAAGEELQDDPEIAALLEEEFNMEEDFENDEHSEPEWPEDSLPPFIDEVVQSRAKEHVSAEPPSPMSANNLSQDEVLEILEKELIQSDKEPLADEDTQRADAADTSPKLYMCNICNYVGTQEEALADHKRRHSKKSEYKCDKCDYKCTSSGILDRHMRRHTGEKPFSCKVCKKTFGFQASLFRHMQSHIADKQYACDKCEQKFKFEGSLKLHMTVHTGERPYPCELCSFKCRSNYDLKRHMLSHTDEKGFTCDVCQHKSKCKQDMLRHKRTHDPDKTHSCQLCPYMSRNKYEISKHMLIHKSERKYSCEICQYRSNMKYEVKRHMRVHKNEKIHFCEACRCRYPKKCMKDKTYICKTCNCRCTMYLLAKKAGISLASFDLGLDIDEDTVGDAADKVDVNVNEDVEGDLGKVVNGGDVEEGMKENEETANSNTEVANGQEISIEFIVPEDYVSDGTEVNVNKDIVLNGDEGTASNEMIDNNVEMQYIIVPYDNNNIMNNNNGILNNNNIMISNNNGLITNSGLVNNSGIVINNSNGILASGNGIINNSSGLLSSNGSIIGNNVIINDGSGIIGNTDSIIANNAGIITSNGGMLGNNIIINDNRGIIGNDTILANNSGMITSSGGMLGNNVIINDSSGMIANDTILANNSGMITNNVIINDNSGIMANNDTILASNAGIIANNVIINDNNEILGNDSLLAHNGSILNNNGIITNNGGVLGNNILAQSKDVVNNAGILSSGREVFTDHTGMSYILVPYNNPNGANGPSTYHLLIPFNNKEAQSNNGMVAAAGDQGKAVMITNADADESKTDDLIHEFLIPHRGRERHALDNEVPDSESKGLDEDVAGNDEAGEERVKSKLTVAADSGLSRMPAADVGVSSTVSKDLSAKTNDAGEEFHLPVNSGDMFSDGDGIIGRTKSPRIFSSDDNVLSSNDDDASYNFVVNYNDNKEVFAGDDADDDKEKVIKNHSVNSSEKYYTNRNRVAKNNKDVVTRKSETLNPAINRNRDVGDRGQRSQSAAKMSSSDKKLPANKSVATGKSKETVVNGSEIRQYKKASTSHSSHSNKSKAMTSDKSEVSRHGAAPASDKKISTKVATGNSKEKSQFGAPSNNKVTGDEKGEVSRRSVEFEKKKMSENGKDTKGDRNRKPHHTYSSNKKVASDILAGTKEASNDKRETSNQSPLDPRNAKASANSSTTDKVKGGDLRDPTQQFLVPTITKVVKSRKREVRNDKETPNKQAPLLLHSKDRGRANRTVVSSPTAEVIIRRHHGFKHRSNMAPENKHKMSIKREVSHKAPVVYGDAVIKTEKDDGLEVGSNRADQFLLPYNKATKTENDLKDEKCPIGNNGDIGSQFFLPYSKAIKAECVDGKEAISKVEVQGCNMGVAKKSNGVASEFLTLHNNEQVLSKNNELLSTYKELIKKNNKVTNNNVDVNRKMMSHYTEMINNNKNMIRNNNKMISNNMEMIRKNNRMINSYEEIINNLLNDKDSMNDSKEIVNKNNKLKSNYKEMVNNISTNKRIIIHHKRMISDNKEMVNKNKRMFSTQNKMATNTDDNQKIISNINNNNEITSNNKRIISNNKEIISTNKEIMEIITIDDDDVETNPNKEADNSDAWETASIKSEPISLFDIEDAEELSELYEEFLQINEDIDFGPLFN